MKHVAITAGSVYGRLDDNKLVSNRAGGIWACKFAKFLASKGHLVTLVLPDLMAKEHQSDDPLVQVLTHKGFEDYQTICLDLATKVEAMVMAAAVVNWIPAEPYKGKMPTRGFDPGDIMHIPFVLAPRVINRMREINPKITLVGCKMLSGSTKEALLEAAYDGVILESKAHVVLANDLSALRVKHLVYPDKCVQTFDNDWCGLYETLRLVIEDKHWKTEVLSEEWGDLPKHEAALTLFDAVADKYRERFLMGPRSNGSVFGSILVRSEGYFLVSSRLKHGAFTSATAVAVQNIVPSERALLVWSDQTKATMNAPLLIRMWQKYRPVAVLHLHEMLPGVPMVPYAPPGTDRDNLRDLPGPSFNIEGHGFVACLDENLEIMGL